MKICISYEINKFKIMFGIIDIVLGNRQKKINTPFEEKQVINGPGFDAVFLRKSTTNFCGLVSVMVI
jgi:hypothetical protein